MLTNISEEHAASIFGLGRQYDPSKCWLPPARLPVSNPENRHFVSVVVSPYLFAAPVRVVNNIVALFSVPNWK